MSEKLLSVIMASYNGEKYLEDTLRSVFDAISETNKKFVEFIFINDGSSDKTEEIFEKYRSLHDFTLIKQNNLGLVKTFNKLLTLATGKFLFRIDHDDILSKGAIDEIISALQKQPQVDMLIYDYIMFTEEGKEKYCKGGTEFKSDDGQNVFAELYRKQLYAEPMWSRVVRRSCLAENGLIPLDETIEPDDKPNSPKAFAYTKKVVYLPEALYCYRINSIASNNRLANLAADYFEKQMTAAEHLYQFALKAPDFSKAYREAVLDAAGDIYWNALDGIKNSKNLQNGRLAAWEKKTELMRHGKTNRKYLYRWLVKLLGVKLFYKIRYKK